uniref:Synaptopodin 2-like protein n=1 Tax=Pundamilia nyererei TaxID=303518 RepID=A0A3B4F7I0_9CICH
MVAEEIVVSLSGGAPWGFRLQGGAEQQKPLQVAKVRRRSKACRAGLKEHDELVAIGDQACAELSHAEAMSLIDKQSNALMLRVKRSEQGHSHTVNNSLAVISYQLVLSPTADSNSFPILSSVEIPQGITSPPDSEAYYGETDSDADTNSELIYQPRQTEWTTPTHTPHSLTPHTITPTPDQGLVEAEEEGDSGFQEAGGCNGLACPPLVSPERAKEALMLVSGKHLVPMVGPQQMPVNDELSTTYMDKARQAKLQRGESLVEKQVKEARTKCRSIASLLTDAPNPNSKGVLMFKKRRQRAKKYTLTCFGKTEEEGGSSILSGSEFEEEGFSGSFDPTWDTGYLDLLDRRSSACPSTTPTSPTTNQGAELDISAYQTPGRVTSANLRPAVVSRASVVLSMPSQTPLQSQNGNPDPSPNHSPNPIIDSHNNSSFTPNPAVLNRTARPFNSGSTPSRASVTSVMFRPPQPKPTPITMVSKPVAAVSTMNIPTFHPPSDARRAVSSTSLYIPPRNSTSNTSPSVTAPPPALSPPSSLSSASFTQPPTHTFSPQPTAPVNDSPVTREQRISVPASRTGILQDARRRSNKKPMFHSVQNRDVSPNPDLLSMVQNMDDLTPSGEAGHESGPEEDWLRLGAEACNFMQAQRGSRAPPVAPKPQTPQVPQLAGKGGQLFARRQNRMDRYIVERSPSVAAAPYSPAQTRDPSPTPSLPATWKYSSNIRAPPPINYNPLLSPSCPPKAQKKPEITKSRAAGPKGQKAGLKPVDIMSHQPYQLNSSLFSYGSGALQDTSTHQQDRGLTGGPQKTARVCEVKRFSTPPPTATGPTLKVIAPRSATTLGEPLRRSDIMSPPPSEGAKPFQCYSPPSQQ